MSQNAYAKSGVDVEAGYEVVSRIKKHVKRTQRLGVLGGLGGFGGAFDLSALSNYKAPVLISGTDGVGTKLVLAIEHNRHDTIGIDCVAMCVNDIIAAGAEPLYFLDYIAIGKTKPEKLEQVIAGVAKGCVQANAALIGGETAEHPGVMPEDDYDIAGFAVGIAEKENLIDGEKNVEKGDVLLGLASSGIHSNGYSLVRRVFADFDMNETLPELTQPLIDELLTPTKIYVSALLPFIKAQKIKGIAHITGGGFQENLPRMFNSTLTAQIKEGSWPILPIFKALENYGKIKHEEMFEIFNMGLGMVLAVAPENAQAIKDELGAFEIGQMVSRKEKAVIIE